jgi:fermentation-respiration switch protein FrsA (DUF1100 family)
LIHGALDRIVPLEQSRDYKAAAEGRGDEVKLTTLDAAGHFDLIAPTSTAWPAVEEAVRGLLKPRRR